MTVFVAALASVAGFLLGLSVKRDSEKPSDIPLNVEGGDYAGPEIRNQAR